MISHNPENTSEFLNAPSSPFAARIIQGLEFDNESLSLIVFQTICKSAFRKCFLITSFSKYQFGVNFRFFLLGFLIATRFANFEFDFSWSQSTQRLFSVRPEFISVSSKFN
jgi:hypothetical protein